MINGKPIIGLTATTNFLPTNGEGPRMLAFGLCNTLAVAKGGGLPIVSGEQCPEDFALICDGMIFTGGPDVPPELYAEKKLNETVRCDPIRDVYDKRLFDAFLKTGKPIFGICRGSQQINVFLGGTLFQDLVEQCGWIHYSPQIRHFITASEESILHRFFGERFKVNSFHHQAIKDLAPCLKATAYSVEGIIEAYEHKTLPIFATQFHPEMMATEYCDGTTADFQPIFNYFVTLAKEYAEK